jgi:hypothetical protein
MAYFSKKWVTPTYYESVFGIDYARDPRVSQTLDLIEEGLYTDFILTWSFHLNNPTWQLRQHFSEKDKIDLNLRSWDRQAIGRLTNTLLPQIEDCVCMLEKG